MLTHVTESGVVYEVVPPPEEVQRRMVTLIKKLYPTFLELRASASGAEEPILVGHATGALHSQPRPRVDARPGGRVGSRAGSDEVGIATLAALARNDGVGDLQTEREV